MSAEDRWVFINLKELEMRKIIGAVFQSVDGVVQGPGGPTEDPTGNFQNGGWVFAYGDDKFGEAIGELFSNPFDLLLGRKTYDIFAAYWPYTKENAFIQNAFNKCQKYVMTRGDAPLSWKNSNRVKTLEELKKVKQSDGPDLVLQGSSTLYPTLLKAGLIDELRLMTFPIVLGKGKKLFGEGTPSFEMTMTKNSISPNGIVVASYLIGGDLKHGSFAIEEPSKLEIERREKMRNTDTW